MFLSFEQINKKYALTSLHSDLGTMQGLFFIASLHPLQGSKFLWT